MKIFFYSNTQYSDKSLGISKKVRGQVKALKKLGHQVWVTSYEGNSIVVMDNNEQIVYRKEYKINKKIFRFLRRKCLIDCSREYVKKNSFDICYLRFHFFDNSYRKLLKEMHKKSKVIVEAHSYPYRSFSKELWRSVISVRDFVYEKACRPYIDLVAGITMEKKIWECPVFKIENAVDIDEISLKKNKNCGESINLIAVTVERTYHGYYKLLDGLKKYYENGGKKDIVIYFVGIYLNETKELVKKLDLEEQEN